MMEHRTSTKPYILHGIKEELLEQLEMRKWSKNDFALHSGLSLKDIENIIVNNTVISKKIAKVLARTFDKSVEHWLGLQKGVADE